MTGDGDDGEDIDPRSSALIRGPSGRPPETPLRWSVRPCARNPVLAVAVAALVLAVSLAVQLYYESPWWGGLALLLLTLSVLPYYASTQYELNDEGVVARGPVVT